MDFYDDDCTLMYVYIPAISIGTSNLTVPLTFFFKPDQEPEATARAQRRPKRPLRQCQGWTTSSGLSQVLQQLVFNRSCHYLRMTFVIR